MGLLWPRERWYKDQSPLFVPQSSFNFPHILSLTNTQSLSLSLFSHHHQFSSPKFSLRLCLLHRRNAPVLHPRRGIGGARKEFDCSGDIVVQLLCKKVWLLSILPQHLVSFSDLLCRAFTLVLHKSLAICWAWQVQDSA